MSQHGEQSTRLGLNEVLGQIQSAKGKVYKDSKSQERYCEVPTNAITKWSIAIKEAADQFSDLDEVKSELNTARKTLTDMAEAGRARERRYAEVKHKFDTNQRIFDSAAKNAEKEVNGLKEQRDNAIKAAKEAEMDKQASLAALKAAQDQINSPESRYDPDVAVQLRNEIAGLKSDVKAAQDQLAHQRASETDANKRLDQAHKELAKKRKDMEEHKIELARLRREAMASKTGVVELFDHEDLDEDTLRLRLGKKAYDKLLHVLNLPASDVRGRVGKFIGFFATAGETLDVKMKGMINVMTKALDLLKTEGKTFIAVVGPWVNSLLKDIVSLQLKTVKFYRLDLEARVSVIKLTVPRGTLKEKVKASNDVSTSDKSWREVAAERRERVKDLLSHFKLSAAARYASAKRMFVNAWASVKTKSKIYKDNTVFGFRVGRTLVKNASRDIYGHAKTVVKNTWALVKLMFVAKRESKGKGVSIEDASEFEIEMRDESLPLD